VSAAHAARDPGVPRIILASASPRRRELLALIGIAHDVLPADIDEAEHPGEAPAAYVERLAREKAVAVSARAPDALVIAADTTVVIDNVILGKPVDDADAARMLRTLSGRSHTVYTAIAAARGPRVESEIEVVSVTFRPLEPDEIAAYIATREPMDKAGAYGIQGYGATIVERIDGDYFAVMGLSLGRTVRLMRRLGVRYEFGRLVEDKPGRGALGGA
jgi:septum formation protein